MMIIILLGLALVQQCCYCYTVDDDQSITVHQNNIFPKPNDSADVWTLRVFPDKTNVSEFDPGSIFAPNSDLIEVDAKCDNGTRNLHLDWDKSMPENHTCAGKTIVHNAAIAPVVHGAWIPPAYTAPHYCMDVKLTYPDPLLTFGGHRKLWARYGEYEYIPRQRWLHNAENGAVIMLYHPCADPHQVEKLRKIVKLCLFRHIITPYNLLPEDQPLALITWGWRLSMNVVRPGLASRFIREHALKAPNNLNIDGKYDYGLKDPAEIVSDENDSRLCVTNM